MTVNSKLSVDFPNASFILIGERLVHAIFHNVLEAIQLVNIISQLVIVVYASKFGIVSQ
jgi:hypothetical protein